MFCPKCGKKNADNARFCEFCGTEIKTEEKIILPRERKIKISKKQIIIISIVFFIIIIFGILYFVLGKTFSPSKVAKDYFLAVMNNDEGKIYDFINIPKNEFTSEEMFEKVNDDENDLDLVNYEVINEEVSSDGLSAQVKISYTLEGRQMADTATIYLIKDKKNKFLIFPNWKISDGSSLVCEDYEIEIFKGASLKLEGVEVSKKYLKEEDDTYKYVIPAIFKGDYDVEITLKNGLVMNGKVNIGNSSFKVDDLNLNDKDIDELKSVIEKKINNLYEAAINSKKFDDIKKDYEYKDSDLSDLEEAYNKFVLFINNSGLREYKLKEFEIDKIDVTDEGYLYITVKADYDYKVKAYLSDDELSKDASDTIYLTFDYKDDFKLIDFSSLDSTFSRF